MDLKYVDPLELTKYNANPYIIIVKFSPPESGDKKCDYAIFFGSQFANHSSSFF